MAHGEQPCFRVRLMKFPAAVAYRRTFPSPEKNLKLKVL